MFWVHTSASDSSLTFSGKNGTFVMQIQAETCTVYVFKMAVFLPEINPKIRGKFSYTCKWNEMKVFIFL